MGYNPPISVGAVLIFTAIELERRAIHSALRGRRLSGGGGKIELHTIGMRARFLPLGLLDDRPRCVIMAGLGGALDPALRHGDVILDGSVDYVPKGALARRARILSTSRLISTPEQKAELFKETGAVAVEMENEVVAPQAAARGVPFLSLRAISDTAAESLDPAVLGLLDDRGRANLGKVITLTVHRPGLIPTLLRLGSASRLAAKNLGCAVLELVEEGPW